MSESAPTIRITGGNPTGEESAAVTAVLSAALDELSGEYGRQANPVRSAWSRSQRSLRTDLARGNWARSSG